MHKIEVLYDLHGKHLPFPSGVINKRLLVPLMRGDIDTGCFQAHHEVFHDVDCTAAIAVARLLEGLQQQGQDHALRASHKLTLLHTQRKGLKGAFHHNMKQA